MERVIVIEVCDEQGGVLERFKTSTFPIRLGRAYDNDLIIDDPYVCAHHCEVVRDEAGEVAVNDLASVNGTYLLGKRVPSTLTRLAADSRLRIGHTTLRIRFSDQAVEATVKDQVRLRHWYEWPPHSLQVNLAILALATVVMMASNYLGSYEQFELGRYFFREQIPALAAVAGWAGIWAIVSRVTMHRFSYIRHATILVSILLVVYLSDYLLEFMKFGFASQWPFELLSLLISGVALALMLFWHLRLCSGQKGSRLVATSSFIAAALIGLVQVNEHLDSREFRSTPLYSSVLKPPSFQIVESKSVDDFLQRTEMLRADIDSELKVQAQSVRGLAVE